MSLIHACELNGVNSFDYLEEVQRHAAGYAKSDSIRVILLALLQAGDSLGQDCERRPVSLEIDSIFRLPAIGVE
jgi:hypothetical protein